MRLANQVAVVTGGAHGIGAGVARRLSSEGATVMIADIDAEASQKTVTEIEAAGGKASFSICDVSSGAQVEALFGATIDTFKRINIVVNNAALVHHPEANAHFLEYPEHVWRRMLEVNLGGLFHCSQRAARIMVRQGQGGCIINVSSGGATRAHRQMMAYDTTKGGIEAATRAIALDLAHWQIRVNAIVPGNIAVEGSIPIASAAAGVVQPADVIPLGRSGLPEDIAAAAAFLASSDATYITGHCLFVDGGMNIQLRSPALDVQVDSDLMEAI